MKKYYIILILLSLFLPVRSMHFKHIGMGDGLSQTSVMSIHQDTIGRMWFGTREGITIYDGSSTTTYKPWADEMNRGRGDALYGNRCDFICSNSEGDVFFRSDAALMRYDIHGQEFRIVRPSGVRTVAEHNGDIWCAVGDSIFTYVPEGDSLRFRVKTGIQDIFSLLVLSEDTIWLATNSGLFIIENGNAPQAIIPDKDIYSVFKSSTQDIWVGSRMEGLYMIAPDGAIRHYRENGASPNSIASNQIREFTEDIHGNIWFGTFEGLQKYNPHTQEFTLYTRNNLPGGLSHTSVFSLFTDRQGTIWAGTYYGGVNYFNPERDIFTHYVDNPNRNDCLNYPFVGNIVEDKNGYVWICTEGGGLNRLDRKSQTFEYFVSEDKNGPPHNNLKSITYDENRDMLYVGTYTGGLTKFHIPTRRFHNYWDHSGVSSSARPNDIIHHTQIYNDNLYIAARNGVFSMNLETEEFTYMNRYCVGFLIDAHGYMWYTSNDKLVRLNVNDLSDVREISLSEIGVRFEVNKFIEYRGDIYFGTQGAGLYRYSIADDVFTPYTVSSGHLISNYCYAIAETKSGNLLITGDKGVTFFNPKQETSRFIKLGVSLPITSITEGCGLTICDDDEIFVGGSDGLTSFREAELYLEEKEYSLYFSDISIHNRQLFPGDGTNVLSQALPFTNEVRLAHNQNNIVFNFASTNYIDIQRNTEYEYMLEGFDSDWNPTGHYSIHYTNLNPGSYRLVLREKAGLFDTSQIQTISLSVYIARPWYNTVWAWMAYILIFGSALAFIIHTRNARRIMALSLEKEQLEKERNEKLTEAKLHFFTSISHEFRVPLTLIIGQLDLLSQSTSLAPNVYNKILSVGKNANRMRGLINELLDFQKLEQNFVALRVSEQDLVSSLKDIYLSFNELAQQNNIDYRISGPAKLNLWFDAYQLQKVFFNLISNAFKYTRKGGSIDLVIKEEETEAVIQIIDNGIGLTPEESKMIFDLFYQAENGSASSTLSPGTGIGLALSQHIVQLHHGEISVQSERDYGTIFIVKLPKGKAHFENDGKSVVLNDTEELMTTEGYETQLLSDEDYRQIAKSLPEKDAEGKYSVLLVEDNEELLQMLHTLFSPLYRVHLAHDGKEGLEIAMKEKPDLIVSDVMMPRMSGTEMCTHIKSNIDLCHIPVVLLTALDSVEKNIEGLQQGADDYIAKPFHSKMLLIRCNNIIRNRLLMQRQLNEQPDFELSSLAINTLDQKLLTSINEVIEMHLDNAEFDVDILAADVGLSRSSLFAKFKALTGVTPNEYIVNKRLARAAILLRERPELQIVEIAEQFGFGSTVYFSRVFKAKYGSSPTQYRKNNL